MKLSVIVSTYNSPQWLEKVLWGYQTQIHNDFELLIADDGSGSETVSVIRKMQCIVHFPIRHIWREDNGFNKCSILNKAVLASSAAYLVFSDGDCIPRADFLCRHDEKARSNYFLSGGVVRLPLKLSQGIEKTDIISQEAFERQWLISKGLRKSVFKNLKLVQSKRAAILLNRFSPTRATWNGGNSSGWKKDILEVNGFDERMRYGSEDREFGDRLMNKGVKGIKVRYNAVCLHLHHDRDYVNDKDLSRNAGIRKHTRQSKSTWTTHGIIQGLEQGWG